MTAEDNYQGGENAGKGRGNAMCLVSGMFLSEEEETRGGVNGEERRQGEFREDKGTFLMRKVSSGDSEAKPLIFTFVPTVRRLPTHCQLADTSKFLVKIPEEPSDKNPETVNRSNFNEYLTVNAGSQPERDQEISTYPSGIREKISQGRGFKANKPQGMQQSDLFKAEYVFIVDSEGEDEAINRKGEQSPPSGMGTTATRPKSLAITSSLVSDVVRPKTRGANLQAPSHPEMPHGIAPQQKHGQAFQLSPSALHPNCGNGILPSRRGKSESSISDHMSSVSTPSPPISLTRTKELISPCALSMSTGPENKKPKQYKTKSSYKAFAAIPTNTLLLEQKALDEPAKTESVSKDNTLGPPLEHSSDSPSSSLQTLLSSDTVKTPTTLPRAAGRETKYANLSSPSSTVSESQLTKPGVIRPVPVKSKILLKKEEEVYEPNPFSKYLEDNNDIFSEQGVTIPHKPVSLHPLYQTRLYPPAKSLLHPQTLSHADCLTPGPFSHLSSFSLTDEQENSHTPFSHNAYNKLSHPMVAIPEHDTLDSKEQ
ncbi:muscular LMNA-interacting protein [Pteropus medius]|uniref:muscular LMNA-interacting protein n=1 Tax=Pteropus vampyrus TaxID=132908 RepID=UPI00196B56E2|nr:muscular LMNA-interacting protein [Pteropus giganteus]